MHPNENYDYFTTGFDLTMEEPSFLSNRLLKSHDTGEHKFKIYLTLNFNVQRSTASKNWIVEQERRFKGMYPLSYWLSHFGILYWANHHFSPILQNSNSAD